MYKGDDLVKYNTEKQWLKVRGREIAMVLQDPMTSLNPLKTIGSQIMEAIAGYESQEAACVEYPLEEITHIFFHTLVYDTAKEDAQRHRILAEERRVARLKAMEELSKLEEERGNPEYCNNRISADKRTRKDKKDSGRTASNEMCVFLIMNIASLQLIPVNMIAYRSQYGSVSPTAVIAPGLIATFVSAVAAVIYCKIMDKATI